MKQFLIICLLCSLAAFKTSGQCDSEFYKFKRNIIETISYKIDSIESHASDKSNIFHIEFSNYESNGYYFGNPRSTFGFFFFITDTCYNLRRWDSVEIRENIKYHVVDKIGFNIYMGEAQLGDIVLNSVHTQEILISDPIEGWQSVAMYALTNGNFIPLKSEFAPRNMHLNDKAPFIFTVPVYSFENRILKSLYLLKVSILSMQKKEIQIISIKDIKL